MGVGIAGGLMEWGGDSIKQNALENGALNNKTILDGDTGGAMMSTAGSALSGAATGALIGSVIPVVGTAVGAAVGGVIGAGMGVWDNRDTMQRNYQTMADGAKNLFSPEEKLETTRVEAEKKRLENQTPQAVQIVGPEADAIRSTAITTGSAAEVARQQLGEQKKTNEFKKSKADIRAMLDAQRANVDSTRQRFANLDNS
jgi:phage tail tape-measure protein